ncbi:hypothetical protein DCCM_3138 [Desulfocucumis palustris]|uniref:Uncharacterized protein n=1 Tax=Desulfocucumis palustris TaxID=1898651 RepID=A0A2L2XCG5_9FIRM|nr:hypothetical protein DCCM_3138 [Desulfocucumis palustris]
MILSKEWPGFCKICGRGNGFNEGLSGFMLNNYIGKVIFSRK